MIFWESSCGQITWNRRILTAQKTHEVMIKFLCKTTWNWRILENQRQRADKVFSKFSWKKLREIDAFSKTNKIHTVLRKFLWNNYVKWRILEDQPTKPPNFWHSLPRYMAKLSIKLYLPQYHLSKTAPVRSNYSRGKAWIKR